MSGTSLDGVDAALLLTDGEVIHDFGRSGFRAYSAAERSALQDALGLWPDPEDPDIAAAASVIEACHVELLAQFPEAEVIGFHGQTLAHDPKGQGTHQIGDGAALAQVLGRDVVWDFRTSDVALGGEGAPLAPAYHFACAQWIAAEGPIAFVNLGGVGNLTWDDPVRPCPEAEGERLAFDTGPANAPINDVMTARLGRAYDDDGALAATGRAHAAILDRFLADSYFLKVPPKSLDRNDFSSLLEEVVDLGDVDAVATLTEAAALGVAAGMIHCPTPPRIVYATGGGRKNQTLMRAIEAHSGVPVCPVEEVGLDGDMLEAQAFAFLAVRVLRGLPTSFSSTTGVAAAVGGGQISRVARPARLPG